MAGFTWSYSLWSQFKKCPLSYKYKKIDKVQVPQAQNFAQARGTEVHSLAEGFLKGIIKGMPDQLKPFAKQFRAAKKNHAESEIDLAITREFAPSKWDDWNNVWCRGNIDMGEYLGRKVARFVDFKTGKEYPEHKYQADLYALMGFCHYDVNQINVEFWYLSSGTDKDVGQYKIKKDFKRLKDFWVEEVQTMIDCKDFHPAKEKWLCKWCIYNESNGGPCPHGK